MTTAQLGVILTSAAALVVAVGHLIADLTGLTDAVKGRRAARKKTASPGGGNPGPAAR